jgi:hypothetical protein
MLLATYLSFSAFDLRDALSPSNPDTLSRHET